MYLVLPFSIRAVGELDVSCILNSVLQKAHETCNTNIVCVMTKRVFDALHIHIVRLGVPLSE